MMAIVIIVVIIIMIIIVMIIIVITIISSYLVGRHEADDAHAQPRHIKAVSLDQPLGLVRQPVQHLVIDVHAPHRQSLLGKGVKKSGQTQSSLFV
jgi:flagellar biosynthesis/type III secretory pathway M-ring protein FliF/YscJ